MEKITLFPSDELVRFGDCIEDFSKIINDKNFMDEKNYLDNYNLKVLGKALGYLEGEAYDSSQLLYGFIVGYDLASIMSLSSFKENLFGVNINANDMEFVHEIFDVIDVRNPKIFHKNGSFVEKRGWARLLSEIRNGIIHDHFLICKEGIYINNSQSSTHKIDFEAFISRKFFDIIYHIIQYNNRKPDSVFIDGRVDWGKGYVANKSKIKIIEAKEKTDPINWLQVCQKMENVINNLDKLGSEYDIRDLSQDQSDLLAKFFGKYDFTLKNLIDVTTCIDKNCFMDLDMKMRSIIEIIIGNIAENMNVNGVTNIVFDRVSVLNELMEIEINNLFTDEVAFDLGSVKLPLNRLAFLKRYMKGNYSDWIIHDSEKIKKISDNNPAFIRLCDKFRYVVEDVYRSREFALELLPNYLKMLYLMRKYTSDSEINSGTLDSNTSAAGHIRNALSHRNFFILPGVDSVLLIDESQEKGKPDLKKMYSLQDLYDGTADLTDPWEEVI